MKADAIETSDMSIDELKAFQLRMNEKVEKEIEKRRYQEAEHLLSVQISQLKLHKTALQRESEEIDDEVKQLLLLVEGKRAVVRQNLVEISRVDVQIRELERQLVLSRGEKGEVVG
jgi:mannose-6-phosphate isomerase class I